MHTPMHRADTHMRLRAHAQRHTDVHTHRDRYAHTHTCTPMHRADTHMHTDAYACTHTQKTFAQCMCLWVGVYMCVCVQCVCV